MTDPSDDAPAHLDAGVLERLLADATPLPWNCPPRSKNTIFAPDRHRVASVHLAYRSSAEWDANAALIVAAVNALPSLLRALREAARPEPISTPDIPEQWLCVAAMEDRAEIIWDEMIEAAPARPTSRQHKRGPIMDDRAGYQEPRDLAEPQPAEGEALNGCQHEWCMTSISTTAGERQGIRCTKCGVTRDIDKRPSPTQGDEGALREAFNVNDAVLVTLRESGAEILRKRDAELDALIKARGGKGFTRAEPSTTEPTKYPLWEMMQIFGPHISLGRETPFDTQMWFARPLSTRPTPPDRGDEAAFEAVQVTAADYNGQTWDGSPFRVPPSASSAPLPDWLSEAVSAGRISVKPDDRDYAVWAVLINDYGQPRFIAEPGDWIVNLDGALAVLSDEAWRAFLAARSPSTGEAG